MKYLNGLMATAVFVAFGTWLLALSILIISYELVIRVVAWLK